MIGPYPTNQSYSRHSCAMPRAVHKIAKSKGNELEERVLYKAINEVHRGDGDSANLVGPMIAEVMEMPVSKLAKIVSLIDTMKSALVTVHGTSEFEGLAMKTDKCLLSILKILKRDFMPKVSASVRPNEKLKDFLKERNLFDLEAVYFQVNLAYLNCLLGYMFLTKPEFIRKYISKFD